MKKIILILVFLFISSTVFAVNDNRSILFTGQDTFANGLTVQKTLNASNIIADTLSGILNYDSITNKPYIPDTSPYLKIADALFIDTNMADARYLSISADTYRADWSKIDGIPNLFYSDSSIDFSKVVGDTVSKYYVDTELTKKLNISDSFSGSYSDLRDKPFIPDTSIYITSDSVYNNYQEKGNYMQFSDSIVFSGFYNDLTEKPIIPDTSLYLLIADSIVITKISELQNDSNFISLNDINESLTVKLSNTDTDTIRNMAGTINYETEVSEIYIALQNVSDTKLKEIGDSVALLDSSVNILSDSIVELENRVNTVEDSIPMKVSQLQNDSNFISYNDSLYFTLLNPTSLVADTSIINDTLLFNDTACWVIYGDSYNVDLNNYTYNYEVFFDTGLAAGTWGKSELFVYRDKVRNLIVFKSAVYNFAEGNIEITFLKRR